MDAALILKIFKSTIFNCLEYVVERTCIWELYKVQDFYMIRQRYKKNIFICVIMWAKKIFDVYSGTAD